MFVAKKRQNTTCWKTRRFTWQSPKSWQQTRYPLRKCSRFLASTSSLRVCLSAANGWVSTLEFVWPTFWRPPKVTLLFHLWLSPSLFYTLVDLSHRIFEADEAASWWWQIRINWHMIIRLFSPICVTRSHALVDTKIRPPHSSTLWCMTRYASTYKPKMAFTKRPIFRWHFKYKCIMLNDKDKHLVFNTLFKNEFLLSKGGQQLLLTI